MPMRKLRLFQQLAEREGSLPRTRYWMVALVFVLFFLGKLDPSID